MATSSSALKALSQTTFDALLTVDDDRRYLTTNRQGTALLHASSEYLLSHAIDDLTSFQFQSLLPDLWGALERDGALSGAYEVKRGDGSIGWIEFAAKRDLFDGQHLIVARELPGRPQARRAVGFALVNPRSGEIEEASPECCRLLGRSRSELIAAGLHAFGGKRQADEAVSAIRRIAGGTEASFTFQCTARREGGATQSLVVMLRPVFGARRRPVRILLEVITLVVAPVVVADTLTARECEVLQLAADGGTAGTIAERLVLSPGTVRTHLRNIYAKLGASDRAAAVAEGMRRGLIR